MTTQLGVERVIMSNPYYRKAHRKTAYTTLH